MMYHSADRMRLYASVNAFDFWFMSRLTTFSSVFRLPETFLDLVMSAIVVMSSSEK